MANAEAKAATVARAHPRRWVLGADTVVVLDHHLFGKPRDAADAVRMLGRLQGRTHRVITAVCLLRPPDRGRRFAVTSWVTFRAMDAEGIRGYLRRVHTLDKAGAYAAQEHAGLIIRRVTGSWSNVVGLPMERLSRELRGVGFPVRAPRAKRLAFFSPPP
jgi:septum formation protein